jgi:glycosyltransferase involved in cell wall biosynthesis
MSDQNSKIKILHLTNTIRRGGKERQMFTIYRNCPANLINKVVSIHQSNSSYLDEYEVKDEDVYFLKTRNNLKRVWRFRKIAEHEKPDVVYAWDTLSYLIAVLAGFFLPYRIINGSIRHGIRSNNLAQYWRTFILHLSRNIVANSRAGLHANNLKRGLVLYNGISHKFFNPVHNLTDREVDNISLRRPVFISVASLIPYKDYFTVIEALANLHRQQKRFTYLIVGDGPNREMIVQQIVSHSMENKIHVVGAKVNVIDYLHKSDVFIHSSKGEGCSNAILEAMAARLPIIASDTGGTSEIVEKDFGRLFPYKNTNALYTLISELAFDQTKIAEMGRNAKATARRKYGVDRMIDNFQAIIKQVASKK